MDPQTRTGQADAVVAALAARQWGVYAVGHRQLRREGHWLAAVLATGPRAVLSHRDAAALHDLRPANHARIDVTTTADRTGGKAIRMHRTRVLDDQDVTTVQGIPVTTVAPTLADLAGVVPADHLASAIKEAERRNALDMKAVERVLARTKGRPGPGHRALREAIAEHVALGLSATRSPLEDAFLELVRDANLPRPATNATIEGFEVDAVWRTQRIVVELDGWDSHRSRKAFQEDRERDALLTTRGWRVVRFTHHSVVRRPERTIETLRRLGLA
jgi:very-short-patch-repair endonuclease